MTYNPTNFYSNAVFVLLAIIIFSISYFYPKYEDMSMELEYTKEQLKNCDSCYQKNKTNWDSIQPKTYSDVFNNKYRRKHFKSANK